MAVAHGLALTVADVEAAASRIRGVVVETSPVRNLELDELTGARGPRLVDDLWHSPLHALSFS